MKKVVGCRNIEDLCEEVERLREEGWQVPGTTPEYPNGIELHVCFDETGDYYFSVECSKDEEV